MTELDPAIDVDFSGHEAGKDWHEVQRRGVKWAHAPVDMTKSTKYLPHPGIPWKR